MRCTSPRTVGFKDDGRTISWSPKQYSKEYATFQLPCGKCINCRLEYARSWAVRCVHEASVHSSNSFITLTYADKYLTNPKLNYEDFQLFMKRLRDRFSDLQIGMFVTGEYGEKQKRPHWHAILFNWRPQDALYRRKNELGDRVFSSRILGPYTSDEVEECSSWETTPLWPYGKCELGDVSFKSAGYVARYAAKKLVHGKDSEHDFQPISKKSSKNAIGKAFLEKYWPDVFNYGQCVIDGGITCPIPRYYEKWFQKNHPQEWERYVTEVKLNKISLASQRSELEKKRWMQANDLRRDLDVFAPNEITRNETKKIIADERFKRLQRYLKGDI